MSAIKVEHLSKKVPDAGGWLTILDDVGFTVESGDTVAIVGASGSGKSTLLGLLAGLDLPSAGRVVASGQDLFTLDEDARARWRAENVGFVFQSFQLLPQMTALENVMLPLELAGVRDAAPRARDLLVRVGLAERGDHRYQALGHVGAPIPVTAGTALGPAVAPFRRRGREAAPRGSFLGERGRQHRPPRLASARVLPRRRLPVPTARARASPPPPQAPPRSTSPPPPAPTPPTTTTPSG
jgi:ABC-type sugar transport system ATPase subunit